MNEYRPVIVEVTTRHIVWMPGDTPEEALTAANRNLWFELVKDGETDAYTSATARVPDEWDWDDVYGIGYGSGYMGPECNAHVELHEQHQRAVKLDADRKACTAAGHPNTENPTHDGRIWCLGCRQYLPSLNSAGVLTNR